MKKPSFLIVALLVASYAMAQVPSTINFQGNLTVPGTNPPTPVDDGNYVIGFALFDDANEGTELWFESQDPVVVTSGVFNVKLGSVNPLPSDIFSQPVWLDINVNGEPLATRIEFSSTPYSMSSKSLIGDNFIPNSGNVQIGGSMDVGGIAPAIDLAIDDDDTGLEVAADGVLSFYADGIETMALSSLGNRLTLGTPTGIGANSKFEINYDEFGAGTGFGGMYITSTNASGQPYYGYQNGSGNAYTYLDGSDGNKWKLFNGGVRVTVNSGGNVGIGAENPPERLTVAGNILTNGSVTASDFTYETPQVSYYSVPPSQFEIAAGNTTYSLSSQYYSIYIVDGTATGSAFLVAPLNLPHNARVTNIALTLSDSDVTNDITTFQFYEVTNATTSTSQFLNLNTITGTTSGFETVDTDIDLTINNQLYNYWLYIVTRQANSSLRVGNVVITYEEAGP